MSAQTPLVSVLMTVYNRQLYIAEAIESVLSSTYTNFELIVVDDASADQSVEIAKSYQSKDSRIKVYGNRQNVGDYPNRNIAASYATGKYIKYLDSDDIMYSHCLQVMVTSMEQFPEAGFGLSCKGDSQSPYPACLSPLDTYFENFTGHHHFDRAPGSAIINRAAFEKLGGFSGERMIGDNEMWLRLSRYYPMVKFPVDLYWSRTHNQQESHTEYAKQYQKLRRDIFTKALRHPDCPLPKKAREKFIKEVDSFSFKEYFKKLIY